MKHIKQKTYEGIGFTQEERDFLQDGYAMGIYMRTLQRDSKEYVNAYTRISQIHRDHSNLVDSINDKVAAFVKGDDDEKN